MTLAAGPMFVDAYITVICEKTGRDDFRALFYDRPTEQFYGGSGPTALEAVAWCLDEYVARGIHGLGPAPARNSNATPGERFGGQRVDRALAQGIGR